MPGYDKYLDLAEALYEALDDADEQRPHEIDGRRFLQDHTIEDVVRIGVVSLTHGGWFELYAVRNYLVQVCIPVRRRDDVVGRLRTSLDAAILSYSTDLDRVLELADAIEDPDCFYECEDDAKVLASDAIASLSLEDQAALLLKIVLSDESSRFEKRATGAVMRAFQHKGGSAHAEMARHQMLGAALEQAGSLPLTLKSDPG